MQVFRKALASAVTLGSGASLGPEAPSVELGANTAAVLAPMNLSKSQQRMLIAAGAAAGGGCRNEQTNDKGEVETRAWEHVADVLTPWKQKNCVPSASAAAQHGLL